VRRWLVTVACALLADAQAATAQLRASAAPLHAHATLTPVSLVGSRATMLLTVAVDPGWHISWRRPGETGLPTRLAWSLPAGVRLMREVWPVPVVSRTPVGAQHTLEGEVPWLIEFSTDGTGSADRLIGVTLRYGVCRDVCIPEQQAVQGVLPGRDDPSAAVRAALRARLIVDGGPIAVRVTAGTLCLRVPAALPAGTTLDLIADAAAVGDAALPVTRRGARGTVRLPPDARLTQGTAVVLVAGAAAVAGTLDLRAPVPACGPRPARR